MTTLHPISVMPITFISRENPYSGLHTLWQKEDDMAYPHVFKDSVHARLLGTYGLLGLLLLSQPAVMAATFVVINNNESGAGSFRRAVTDANNNPGADTIVFGSITGTININTTISVTDDLTITGPGADVLTLNSTVTTNTDAMFLQSGSNSNLSLTVSDLRFQQDPVSTRRLIRARNEGIITLRNVRLQGNGNAIQDASGGAIAAVDTEVLIQSSVIENFNTEFRGGAVFMQSLGTGETADLTIDDSLFSNNVTSGTSLSFSRHGGAIASERSNRISAKITIRNSSFISNSTLPAGRIAHGGAIYAEDDIDIDHGYFLQNTSTDSGGAIYLGSNRRATLSIRNSFLTENTTSNVGAGGAVYVDNDDLVIVNSTFSNNASAGRGGAVGHLITGVIDIVNSTFSGNAATSVGGAIDSDPTAPGSTRINMLNVTMVGNSASAGGGIYNDLDYNTLTIINSLVAGNSASTTGTEIDGAATIDFSLIGDSAGDADRAGLTELTPGNSIYDMDPMIAALADNGGQGVGRNNAVVIPTHAVLAGSVLIGAGDASATNSSIALPANDQRGDGFARIRDGAVEIGALEYDAPVVIPPPVVDGSNTAVSDGGSGAASWWLLILAGLGFITRHLSAARCRYRHQRTDSNYT